jgi:hypothetical protein
MFDILHGICVETERADEGSFFRCRARGDAGNILATFTAVNAVESFLNIMFRNLAEEFSGPVADRVKAELGSFRFGLESKMRQWPGLRFDGEPRQPFAAPVTDSRYKAFAEVKERRNRLMHFKSSYDSVFSPDESISIHGLCNVGVMAEGTPLDALRAANGFVELVLECRGYTTDQVARWLRHWTGQL